MVKNNNFISIKLSGINTMSGITFSPEKKVIANINISIQLDRQLTEKIIDKKELTIDDLIYLIENRK